MADDKPPTPKREHEPQHMREKPPQYQPQHQRQDNPGKPVEAARPAHAHPREKPPAYQPQHMRQERPSPATAHSADQAPTSPSKDAPAGGDRAAATARAVQDARTARLEAANAPDRHTRRHQGSAGDTPRPPAHRPAGAGRPTTDAAGRPAAPSDGQSPLIREKPPKAKLDANQQTPLTRVEDPGKDLGRFARDNAGNLVGLGAEVSKKFGGPEVELDRDSVDGFVGHTAAWWGLRRAGKDDDPLIR